MSMKFSDTISNQSIAGHFVGDVPEMLRAQADPETEVRESPSIRAREPACARQRSGISRPCAPDRPARCNRPCPCRSSCRRSRCRRPCSRPGPCTRSCPRTRAWRSWRNRPCPCRSSCRRSRRRRLLQPPLPLHALWPLQTWLSPPASSPANATLAISAPASRPPVTPSITFPKSRRFMDMSNFPSSVVNNPLSIPNGQSGDRSVGRNTTPPPQILDARFCAAIGPVDCALRMFYACAPAAAGRELRAGTGPGGRRRAGPGARARTAPALLRGARRLRAVAHGAAGRSASPGWLLRRGHRARHRAWRHRHASRCPLAPRRSRRHRIGAQGTVSLDLRASTRPGRSTPATSAKPTDTSSIGLSARTNEAGAEQLAALPHRPRLSRGHRGHPRHTAGSCISRPASRGSATAACSRPRPSIAGPRSPPTSRRACRSRSVTPPMRCASTTMCSSPPVIPRRTRRDRIARLPGRSRSTCRNFASSMAA